MKAIGLDAFGGPEVLHVVERRTEQPGDGEVRIRVEAAAVNPADLTFRSGGRAAQLAKVPPPWVPGMDVAGTIDALGPRTDGRLNLGQRVVAYVLPFSSHGGAYTEQLVLPEASVVAAPATATGTEAATLLLNAVTARLALDALALVPDQPVLVTGAAGAVGKFALELARLERLTVVAQARAGDEALVRRLGVDVLLDHARELTGALRESIGNLNCCSTSR